MTAEVTFARPSSMETLVAAAVLSIRENLRGPQPFGHLTRRQKYDPRKVGKIFLQPVESLQCRQSTLSSAVEWMHTVVHSSNTEHTGARSADSIDDVGVKYDFRDARRLRQDGRA